VIDITPSPIAIQIGPLPIHWYGIAYALGLAVAYWVLQREARFRGQNPELIFNGLVVVAVAALIGGRLYHVIDQWDLYKDNLPSIVLPPYSGLGVYGGLITGTIAGIAYVRWKRHSIATWADIIAPSLFVMQAIGRWGNFFNQELYGSPTSLPWGIAIQCGNRTQGYSCRPGSDPAATLGQHFQPLFLYESISGLLGALFLLYLARRFPHRLLPGDLLLVFFMWYGAVRIVLEGLKSNNWLFFGVPTAQVVAAVSVILALGILIARHMRPLRDPERGRPDQPVEPPDAKTSAAPENG
jgi:phosphatidylglycerol:prolipoprotein diacylglycerol transferase